jgi:PAS domain S-box-containing protein
LRFQGYLEGFFMPTSRKVEGLVKNADFRARLLSWALSSLIFLATALQGQSMASSPESSALPSTPRVLVLHSYHVDFTWSDNISSGIRSAFSEYEGRVELLFEFMDTRRIFTEEYFLELKRLWHVKYAKRQPDVIICSDDHAFNFALRFEKDLFPNVPMVFCSVSGYQPFMRQGRQLTGLQENIAVKETLDVALKIHPDTKRVAIITDMTRTGRALKIKAEKVFGQYTPGIQFDYLEDLTMEELTHQVSSLSDNTIIFLFIFTRDKAGRVFSHEENLEILSRHCKVPIYAVWEFYLDHGIVGGMLTSGTLEGNMAGKMALRILRGEKASDIPLAKSPTEYMFDHAQLARFNITESMLPPNSIVINKPFSFYEQYKLLLWIVSSVIVVLLVLVLVLVGNIVQRKQAESALKQSEVTLTSIFGAAPVGIGLVSNRVLKQVNDRICDMTGYSCKELLEQSARILYPSQKDFEYVGKEKYRQISEWGTGTVETKWLRKDGEVIDVLLSSTPLDPNDLAAGVTFTSLDITDRKHAERQREALISELEAKNAELEQFTYTVSHDLKSPLITIKGFVGLLKKNIQKGNEERIQADMKRISDATEKMEQLLEDLLALSRIGRFTNPSEEVPFGDLAREAVEMVAGDLASRGVAIEIGSGLPSVYGDRVRLREVLQNLIDNAVKFMGDQRTPLIQIGTERKENEDVFYVRDNGRGIDPKYHERVFGLFDRLEQETHGTGIGLAIVKRIVEFHGGQIWIDSKGPGQGSTFQFTVPRKNLGKATEV